MCLQKVKTQVTILTLTGLDVRSLSSEEESEFSSTCHS